SAVIYSSWFFIAIFVTGIFLCGSKLGLIAFFFCMPILVFYKYREKIGLKGVLFMLSALLVLIWLGTVLFPTAFARMNSLSNVSVQELDKTSVESTAVRLLIWEQAWRLIGENWLTGTGAGD